uniref:C-X-C motif chemokine 16 n=1 Tax=Nannospalax galili TaxID=1026970 RepID=A0A8C6QCJ6_NANGA
MGPGWGLALPVLFVLALLTQSGDGNEGSTTGSCVCLSRFHGTLSPNKMAYLRKHLKVYNRCQGYIRFQVKAQSVCGSNRDPWVLDLVSCFDRKECGYDHWKSSHHQGHLLPSSTQLSELTEEALPDMSSPAEILSTQQPTLPSGEMSLDKELTHTHLRETTTIISGHSLEAGSDARANEQQKEDKQQEKKSGAAAGTSAMVSVLSLMAIVFLLTIVLVYVLCQRRKQSQQNFPDIQFYYTPDTRLQ